MARLILLLICLTLTGCGTTWHGSLGYADSFFNDSEWEGDQPAVILEVRKQWDNNMECRYTHVSNLLSGPPFNNRDEDSVDFVGCGIWFDTSTVRVR